MAEAVFANLVREAGLEEQIEIDSAGTGDWHIGSPAHEGTRAILDEQQIEYDGRARQITAGDLEKFDYIITMDNQNLQNVRALAKGQTRAKIVPLLQYSLQAGAEGITEVPDPYLVGGFDTTYRLINSACHGLLNAIRKEHYL